MRRMRGTCSSAKHPRTLIGSATFAPSCDNYPSSATQMSCFDGQSKFGGCRPASA